MSFCMCKVCATLCETLTKLKDILSDQFRKRQCDVQSREMQSTKEERETKKKTKRNECSNNLDLNETLLMHYCQQQPTSGPL